MTVRYLPPLPLTRDQLQEVQILRTDDGIYLYRVGIRSAVHEFLCANCDRPSKLYEEARGVFPAGAPDVRGGCDGCGSREVKKVEVEPAEPDTICGIPFEFVEEPVLEFESAGDVREICYHWSRRRGPCDYCGPGLCRRDPKTDGKEDVESFHRAHDPRWRVRESRELTIPRRTR